MDVILYLHGFHSSPYSSKAMEFKRQMEMQLPHIKVIAPQLPALPLDAIKYVTALSHQYKASLIGVVGSSMGGYLATYIHNEFNVPAVVINPAGKPFELLNYYLGEQEHPITNERYLLEEKHIADLRSIYQPSVNNPEIVWALQQTADEVLDYNDTVEHYKDCLVTVESGGSHAFEGFERYPTDIAKFILSANQVEEIA